MRILHSFLRHYWSTGRVAFVRCDYATVCSPHLGSCRHATDRWGLFKACWEPCLLACCSPHGSAAGVSVAEQKCSTAFQTLRERAVFRHSFWRPYFFLNLYVHSACVVTLKLSSPLLSGVSHVFRTYESVMLCILFHADNYRMCFTFVCFFVIKSTQKSFDSSENINIFVVFSQKAMWLELLYCPWSMGRAVWHIQNSTICNNKCKCVFF